MVEIASLICPECGESAQDRPPVTLTYGGSAPGPWSHRDGTPLCPIVGSDGYVACEPIEITPRDLTADEIRTLDGIMFNYGPFDPSDILDVVDLIDSINDATDGDIRWADVSAVFSYFRRSHVIECDYVQSGGNCPCDCVRHGGSVAGGK